MSQAGIFSGSSVAPGSGIETITGNNPLAISPDISNNIFIKGDGTTIDIFGTAIDNTLTVSVIGSGSLLTLNGDIGDALSGSVFTFNANSQAGSSVEFSTEIGTDTMSLVVTDPGDNTIIGESAGNGSITGVSNTALGKSALASLTSGDANVAMGFLALTACTTGADNVAVGPAALGLLTSGILNTAIGSDVLTVTTGNRNIAIGQSSANAYVSTESNNIMIGSSGIAAENNTIRLGTNGAGSGQQSRCFIAGIDGVNVGSTATVVTEAGNQLGTAVITAGTGITVTAGANAITIASSATAVSYTNVNTTPYIVQPNDYYLSVDSSGGPILLRFPNAAALSKTYVVKDRLGTAGTNSITITTVGGATNIDLATTFVMNTNLEAVFMIGNGTSYEIY